MRREFSRKLLFFVDAIERTGQTTIGLSRQTIDLSVKYLERYALGTLLRAFAYHVPSPPCFLYLEISATLVSYVFLYPCTRSPNLPFTA